MADDTKKKMKAELKAEPWAEMNPKTLAWAKGVPMFKKRFKPIVFAQDVTLDARKWDSKKLSKALYALVRYELKVFAVQGSDWTKKVAKGGMKAELEAVSKYTKSYEKLCREIATKCSVALEELEQDKGDNRRSLKDTKAAFSALAGTKPKSVFVTPAEVMVLTLQRLAKDLDAANGDAGAQQKAHKAAQATAEKVAAGIDKAGGDVQAGLDMLFAAAKTIKKTKDASPLLAKFGKALEKMSGPMRDLDDKIEDFGSAVQAAIDRLKAGALTAGDAASAARDFAGYAQYGKAADSVLAVVGKLNVAFAKIEKELK